MIDGLEISRGGLHWSLKADRADNMIAADSCKPHEYCERISMYPVASFFTENLVPSP
jgi:hypothetical protein